MHAAKSAEVSKWHLFDTTEIGRQANPDCGNS